jgi:hypothetical protein
MGMIAWVILLSFFTAVISPWLMSANSPIATPAFGIGMGFVLMLLVMGTLVCCARAVVKGERAWAGMGRADTRSGVPLYDHR